MTASLLSNDKAFGSNGGTVSINTVGADLLVIKMTGGLAGFGNAAPTDLVGGLSNTIVAATSHYTAGNSGCRIYYVLNPPKTGASHAFTSTGNGYSTMFVEAWSFGGNVVGLDVQSGAIGGVVTSKAPGSVTATTSGMAAACVADDAAGWGGSGAPTINDSFTILDTKDFNGVTNFPGSSAYKIVSAGTVNPTFSWTTNPTGDCAAALVVFKDLGPTPRSLRPCGDSMTATNANGGAAATGESARWAYKFAAALGYTEVNIAAPSTLMEDEASDAISSGLNQFYLGSAIPSTDMWALMVGYNNVRCHGRDATGLESFKRTLRSALAWISRSASDCYQGQNAAWTYVGTWSNITANNLATKRSTTSGDTASIVVTGTAITLSYISYFNLGSIGGHFSVKIDGVTVNASVDMNFGSVSPYSSSGTTYVPMALRFDGLSPGPHTVLVTLLDNAYTQIGFICGNGEATKPEVRICGPVYDTLTGWALFSANSANFGSNAAVSDYTEVIKGIVIDANKDGRYVKYGDTNSFVDIANISGDDAHFADAGNEQFFKAFQSARVLWQHPTQKPSLRLGLRA